jgi:hypothetical protein
MKCIVSVLVSSLFVGQAFAAVSPKSTADVSTTEVSKVTTTDYSEATRTMSVQLLGISSRMNYDVHGTVAGQKIDSIDGSIQGKSVGGVSAGVTIKTMPTVGFEGEMAMLTRTFTEGTFNGKTQKGDGEESIQYTALRATGLARYYLIPQLSIGAGPFASMFVGSAKETDEKGRTTHPQWDENMNRLDYGAALSARGEVAITRTAALVLDARYYHGFANLMKEGKIREETRQELVKSGATNTNVDDVHVSQHTRDIQIGAGVAFVF